MIIINNIMEFEYFEEKLAISQHLYNYFCSLNNIWFDVNGKDIILLSNSLFANKIMDSAYINYSII